MGQHQVDAIVQDQFLRHFRRTVRVRLAVLDDDFNLDRVSVVGQSRKGFLQTSNDPVLRLAKPPKGPVVGATRPILNTASCATARVADSKAGAARSPPVVLMNLRRV